MHARSVVLALVAIAGVTGCGGDGGRATHAVPRHTTTTTATTAQSDGGQLHRAARVWAAPNADLANTRRVGGPIDSSSVSRLRVAWRVPIAASGYAATPVVVDQVLYTQDLDSNVYAIDLASGALRWRTDLAEGDVGPNGVTVGDGRVYGATRTYAFALDAASGKLLWRQMLIRSEGDMVDIAPAYAAGTLYISTAAAGGGAVGTLWALDGASGRPQWRWEQVPAELWGHPDVNGAGGMWHTPALDGHGSVYGSIANPLSASGDEGRWGGTRPGANKWTNSIVKLNARTGAFTWGRQVIAHDIYDWDLQLPVILTRSHGRVVALTGGKMGKVYAFDAGSGRPLWQRSVGRHNGHDADNLLALHHDYAPLERPVKVLPGNFGGLESQMAIDDDTVYAAVNELWLIYGGAVARPQQDLMEGRGEVVALDIATGKIKWAHRLPHSPYGGATVVNDLVFTTTYDGTIWALDTHTGKLVWRSALPAGTNAPVAISGDTLIAAGSLPLAEGQRAAIVAYRLDM